MLEAFDPQVATLAAALHALDRDAATIDTRERRATIYGRILTVCAECHQWLGGGPSYP